MNDELRKSFIRTGLIVNDIDIAMSILKVLADYDWLEPGRKSALQDAIGILRGVRGDCMREHMERTSEMRLALGETEEEE